MVYFKIYQRAAFTRKLIFSRFRARGLSASGQRIHLAQWITPIYFLRRIQSGEVFVHDRVAIARQFLLPERQGLHVKAVFRFPQVFIRAGNQSEYSPTSEFRYFSRLV